MRITIAAVASFAAAVALLVSGCGGSDTSGTAEGSTAEALPNRVTVTMGEWYFRLDAPQVRAGRVTLTARNVGKLEHELVAVKTNLSVDELPTAPDGEVEVGEAGTVVIGEEHTHGHSEADEEHGHSEADEEHGHSEADEEHGHSEADEEHGHSEEGDMDHIAAGKTRRFVVDLKPGKYVLLCSIPGHYQMGQYVGLVAVR